MTLLAVFAVVLAAVGIYGVLSYSVAQRTREIGIRIALGASSRCVISAVVREAILLTAAGAVLGFLVAVRLTPLLSGLLYGVGAGEKHIFFGCVALLALVAIVASLVPARRAARLDPMTCLRCE